MRKSSPQPTPAPVSVYVPNEEGELVLAKVVQPLTTRRGYGYEGETVIYRYQLIAIQETGEEMFAGKASTRSKALDMKYEWLDSHPEHRDVLIEAL
jgi:hypothetical protein